MKALNASITEFLNEKGLMDMFKDFQQVKQEATLSFPLASSSETEGGSSGSGDFGGGGDGGSDGGDEDAGGDDGEDPSDGSALHQMTPSSTSTLSQTSILPDPSPALTLMPQQIGS